MERSNQFVSQLPSSSNRPPISPKPFTVSAPSPALPVATSSSEGWQMPHFMSQPHQEPSVEVTYKSNKSPPLVISRNPITAIELSSTNVGGITVKTEQGIDYELRGGPNLDLNMEERKLRRLISNRISAKRARVKREEYIIDLEKRLKDLQAEVGVLNHLRKSEADANIRLRMENKILMEKIRSQEVGAELSLAQIQDYQAEAKRYNELYAAELRKVAHSTQQKMQLMESDPALEFETLTIDPPTSLMPPY